MSAEKSKIAYDYCKLSGKIREVYGKCSAFADAIGLSERSLSLKMNNKVGWKQQEIDQACELLGISALEIGLYFFARKVQAS